MGDLFAEGYSRGLGFNLQSTCHLCYPIGSSHTFSYCCFPTNYSSPTSRHFYPENYHSLLYFPFSRPFSLNLRHGFVDQFLKSLDQPAWHQQSCHKSPSSPIPMLGLNLRKSSWSCLHVPSCCHDRSVTSSRCNQLKWTQSQGDFHYFIFLWLQVQLYTSLRKCTFCSNNL